jgi:hypothetical protein
MSVSEIYSIRPAPQKMILLNIIKCPFMSCNTIYILISDVEWVYADDERESNPTTMILSTSILRLE